MLHQHDDYIDISQIGKAVKTLMDKISNKPCEREKSKRKKWKRENGRKEKKEQCFSCRKNNALPSLLFFL